MGTRLLVPPAARERRRAESKPDDPKTAPAMARSAPMAEATGPIVEGVIEAENEAIET